MKTTGLSMLLMLVAMSATRANADDGVFVSASVGSADLTENFDGFDVDADSTAWGLTIGWRFNTYFAVEGGYRNFGRFDQTFDIEGEPVDVSLKADGFVLGVIGSVPIGERFGVFAKAGSFFWDGDSEINSLTVATPGDTNLYFSAGASFILAERLSLSVDVARYDFEDTESDVVSLGVSYRF